MAISGLFYCEILNDENAIYSVVIKIVQPLSQANAAQLYSQANDKSKTKKSNTLSVTAKCSCSKYGDYNLHDPSWINYCPECHRYGTLVFDKPEDCPEGMIRCTNCDADFCAVHGKEHIHCHPTYLTPA